MNQLIKIIVCCILVVQLQAQQKSSIPSNVKNTSPNWQAYKKTTAQSAKELANNKTALLLSNEDKLSLIRTNADQTGVKHYRYQQTYKGIPVEGAIYLMHERGGKVELSNGQLINRLNINTKPSIGVKHAERMAIDYIKMPQNALSNKIDKKKETNYQAEGFGPNSSLVIVDPKFSQNASKYRLAYKFEVRDLPSHIFKDIYVDARDGEILLSLDKIHQCTDIDASGPTSYSGDVDFTACKINDDEYALKSSIGEEGGVLEVRNYDQPFSTLITDAEYTFGDTPIGNEVMWASQQTFDYFYNTFGRPYPDTLTISVVNYNTSNVLTTDGAFYADGVGLFYGNGDETTYNSLTSVDIVAHELAHGVTNFAADLIYMGQPGALSESFSDIFGEMVENEIKPGSNDWIIGSEVVKQQTGKNGIRNMSNPKDTDMLFELPDTYLGTNWVNLPKDNEGVHFNCGVHNYWFYLLSEGNTDTLENDNGYRYKIEGIGKDKAVAIAYWNLNYYLTPTSHFIDAKMGSIQAAKQLFPKDTNVLNQTIEAWNAVGLTDCRSNDFAVLNVLGNDTTLFKTWKENYSDYAADKKFNWNDETPFEAWNGVTLNNEGCVVKLDLSNKNIYQSVPSILGSLKHLDTLNLQNNSIAGNIPASLGNLNNLQVLLLNNNYIVGSLPKEFQQLESLEYLDVSNNKLEGCYDPLLEEFCDLLDSDSKIDEGNQFLISWENFCEGYECSDCRLNDSLTLLKLYKAMDGGNWLNKWNLSESFETWHGVELDELGCVAKLDLSENELSGTLPAAIGDFTQLEILYLNNNAIYGSIPQNLVNLTKLDSINITANALSGCYHNDLKVMCNRLESPFYDSNISNRNFFDARWEDFCNYNTGNCETYQNMNCRQRDSIALLSLYRTTEGEDWLDPWNIDEGIDNWNGVLLNDEGCVTQLDLNNRQLDGFITESLKQLYDIEKILLPNNNLSGVIPNSIFQLKNLTNLTLTRNQITCYLPSTIGEANQLEVLMLTDNKFNGSLPVELFNNSLLRVLHLDHNRFRGSIPVEIEKLQNLSWLQLNHNQFSGNIPKQLGKLYELDWLNLQNNFLEGGLPAALSDLDNLYYFNVDSNALTGCYHENLTKLCSQLAVLNMSRISEGNSFESSWADFCVSNKGICNEPVWPGDFNADGIVNYNDMLYWGLAKGKTGPARDNGSMHWAPQNAVNWNDSIENINNKHQDANGNGTVDEVDLLAFEHNYGFTTDDYYASSGESTFAFEIDVTAFDQNSFTFDLYINSSDSIDLHGLSVSLNFSEFEIIDVFVNEGNSVIPADQIRAIYHEDRETLDISMTQTNGQNTRVRKGEVVLSIIACIAIDNLPGGEPPAIFIEGGGMLNESGSFSSVENNTLHPYTYGQQVNGSLPNTIPLAATIQHHSCKNLGAIRLNIIDGYSHPPYKYNWNIGSNEFCIKNLHAGDYKVNVSDDAGQSQIFHFTIKDERLNCRKANDCEEYLVLPSQIENGIYKANKIQFNGSIEHQQDVLFNAASTVELGIGTDLECISIDIQDCE